MGNKSVTIIARFAKKLTFVTILIYVNHMYV